MELNFVSVVRERDVDLLLLEELTCNTAFRNWFVGQVHGTDAAALVGVYHSVSQAGLGETDLLLLEETDAGRRRATLIENKIDAIPQPRQAQRYRERGQYGVDEGMWDWFKTIIIAPQSYLDATGNVSHYDRAVSYETIRDWLQSGEDERLAFRVHMMNEAIEQNRRGYQPDPHEAVTRFWERYWLHVQRVFPELVMKKPGGKPRKADWPQFLNEELPHGWKLFHKLRSGHVDLQIGGGAQQLDALQNRLGPLLDPDMRLISFQRSAAVRIRVPRIDSTLDFDEQITAVEAGIQAALRLLQLSQ